MNYLATFYKNKTEQLQERLNYLIALLTEGVEDMTPDEIERWLDGNTNNPDQRSKMKDLIYRKRARKGGGSADQSGQQSSGSSQGSSREEEMRRENARRQAEAAQQEQDRARRQAEADERQRQRANSSSESARQQANAEEAARRAAGGAGPQAGEQSGSYSQWEQEQERRWREAGAQAERDRSRAREEQWAREEQEQQRRWAEADERIRAEEEAGKFSNRAKAKARSAWQTVRPAVERETSTPTFDAMGRYAQQMFTKPGETAKAAGSAVAGAATYAFKHPIKTTGGILKAGANIGVPMATGLVAHEISDKAMEMMGFERNAPENDRNMLTQIVSEKPSTRSVVSSAASWAAMDAYFKMMQQFSKGGFKALAPRAAAGAAGVGAATGVAVPVVAYGGYKVGEALAKSLGLQDDMDEKQAVALGQHAPGSQRLGNYPTVTQLQAQTRKQAEDSLEQAKQRSFDTISRPRSKGRSVDQMIQDDQEQRKAIGDVYRLSTSLEQRRSAAKQREEDEAEEERKKQERSTNPFFPD